MLKIPCSKEEKKGLENCHKSQSFFNGINLMQAPGQEKSQTLSTSVADSQSRVRYFYVDIKYFYSQYTNKQYTAGSGLSWNLKLIRKIVELLLERFSQSTCPRFRIWFSFQMPIF